MIPDSVSVPSTWKAHVTRFAIGVGVTVAVALILLPWFDRDIAFGTGIGVSAPITLSGHKGWLDRRVLPWVVLLIIAMGIAGGFLGAVIGS